MDNEYFYILCYDKEKNPFHHINCRSKTQIEINGSCDLRELGNLFVFVHSPILLCIGKSTYILSEGEYYIPSFNKSCCHEIKLAKQNRDNCTVYMCDTIHISYVLCGEYTETCDNKLSCRHMIVRCKITDAYLRLMIMKE